MDNILERFRAIKWHYPPQDPAARGELAHRIAEAGRLPSLREPEHRIDTLEWQDIDQTIVGDFLGYLSLESYELGGFFASALVVGKENRLPGEGYTAS